MDANGQRLWQLAGADDFRPVEVTPLTAWARDTLRLASHMGAPSGTEDPALAVTRLELVPETRDSAGTRARYLAATRQVMASGVLPDEVPIWSAPAGKEPTDLAMGQDGVLYVALESTGELALSDRRMRWPDQLASAPGFKPWRLAAHPDGGVWALDRQNSKLARVHGLPLRPRPYGPYDADVWRPVDENRDPPRIDVLPFAFAVGETPVALSVSPDGRLAVLSWWNDGTTALRFLGELGFSNPVRLNLVRHPYSLGWAEATRIAVLPAGWTEAAVYDVSVSAPALDPVGDFYPLTNHDGGPFAHGFDVPVQYPTPADLSPLNHVSLPTYERAGAVVNAKVIDSYDVHTVWHRLYLEAALPRHTSVIVWLAAADDPDVKKLGAADWFPHGFGDLAMPAGAPTGAYVREASEIPFHKGFLECPRRLGEIGLFTALVQRGGVHGRSVRALKGRYLFLRLELAGDGRSTPELAALRVYGSRFSYRDRYLPELYKEALYQPESDTEGAATPSDFLDRYLASMEGVLTSIEDRVRFSWLLTDPKSAPDEALPWLGTFIGFIFDPLVPPDRRRPLLENSAELYRRRGTLEGIKLAIDIVTDGMVSTGEVVVFEDWRLRRTFATILGAHLEDDGDPLLAQVAAVSGNSFVGDTFFLGDENKKEFLAIFRADLQESAAEQAAVAKLFEQFASRMTLFVHHKLDDNIRALVERVANLEKPAHVQRRTITASENFVIGLASLLGVQTFLDEKTPPQPATVDQTRLGLDGYLDEPPALDPRIGGSQGLEQPVARLPAALNLPLGQPLILDASGSRAPEGRQIVSYLWTRLT